MKEERNLAAFLSVLFLLLGIYFLLDPILKSGQNSDWYILVGAALIALGLVTTSWSINQHLFMRRLERHVRGQMGSADKR
jgi:drug/metabolite transporter (DMT)-like permease